MACRAVNLALAGVMLVACAPVLLLIAALIKLTTRGPVLFVQPRVGLNRRGDATWTNGNGSRRQVDLGGKPFRMYKFRTMYAHSCNGKEIWASPDDPRVTTVGRVLRNYRLDELPQLLNVLRGDMNLVGPRPEQPGIFAHLREHVERYTERQAVLPGITGWAQVNQNYDQSVDDVRRKLSFDLEYIERRSVREDLKIMLRTVPVVIFKEGAW